MVAEDKELTNEINNDNYSFKERIRCYLKKGIEKESKIILNLQKKIQSPLLNVIMLMATFTGNDDFYTIFIPMLMWCDISDYGLMKKEFFKQINFATRNL
ncbi:hypothetical protein BCR32DRAFT_163633 [Anaeromyces robustus]|uniref:Uncharacterized protein n=1 Tax=Anaeromyces robustus TaxID=1754192 RepID=A0A1Y1X9V1_9FUNG|nr:hypothetical protein BCR32DRAFT_163633 [Anaeromyces robustus]|eukprot:ORX82525.1 hypothetical protein BCR32DRAFT_163633 [Anaeromyces robustus]